MEKQVNIIAELPQGIIVHDMSYDWLGKRLAVACSNKKVLVFNRNINQQWLKQSEISISGAPVWKAVWARPQFGILLATCSFDKIIRICEWKRVESNHDFRYDWSVYNISNQTRIVEDIKFLPFKQHGLALALVTADGSLKIFQVNNMIRLKQWSNITIPVNQLGLNCLAWSKNILKEDMIIVVGGKDANTTPRRVLKGMKNQPNGIVETIQPPLSTIFFFSYNKNKQYARLPHNLKENRAVNDVSWAHMNGKSFYLLGVATDQSMKIYELNIREQTNTLDVLKEIKLSNQTTFRISWNLMTNYISASQKDKIRIWKVVGKSIWTEINQIQRDDQ